MPVLRYWDVAQNKYIDLPGLPGAQGPAGPTGPTGPQAAVVYGDTGWHYANSPGEPRLQGCTPYDGAGSVWGQSGIRWRRDAAGCVFLEGIVNPTAVSVTTLIQLPVGFRPAYQLRFAMAGGGVPSYVTVEANGNVVVQWATASTYMFLSGITFMDESVLTPNWVYPAFGSGGWSNLGGGTAPLRYCVDSAGDYHLSGCVTGGTTAVFTLPFIPDTSTMYAVACAPGSGGCSARLDITNAAGMVSANGYTGGGTNAWLSLDGVVVANPGGNWGVPAITNSWVQYGGGWASASFVENSNGVVTVRGLIKSGTTTGQTPIWAASATPFGARYQMGFIQYCTGNARLDVMQNGGINFANFYNAGTNGYLSFNARFFADNSDTTLAIPQTTPGPTGPTGPAGPSAPLVSFYQTLPAPTVASSPYVIGHNFGTTAVFVQCWDAVTNQLVQTQVNIIDGNNVSISVAQNMPNNINVVLMGAGLSAIPIAPADLATKGYVDAKTATLPPPVTGGGFQSFTDVLGIIWVAKPGYVSGAWRPATSVLHMRATITANVAVGATALVNMTTATTDPMGCFSGGGFAVPLAGVYAVTASNNLSASPAAAGNMQTVIFLNGAAATYGNVCSYAAANTAWPAASCADLLVCQVGDQIMEELWTSQAVNASGQVGRTFLDVQYIGPAS